MRGDPGEGGRPQARSNEWREGRLDRPANEGVDHGQGNIAGGTPRARKGDLGSSGRSGSRSNAS